jgi:hypothetical protein
LGQARHDRDELSQIAAFIKMEKKRFSQCHAGPDPAFRTPKYHKTHFLIWAFEKATAKKRLLQLQQPYKKRDF